ncbi:hypothetical protein ACLKA7_005748 [Drosophila subpalustris]
MRHFVHQSEMALRRASKLSSAQNAPMLEIFPKQTEQRKPVGKPLILTCRPNVPDQALVTDLQWKDNMNNTILPKPTGRNQPPMYTETLPGDSLALMITSLSSEMTGKYYCTASYANTDLLLKSVSIKTYVAITWTNAPENQYPILGDDYVVKCEVKADPNPTIDWLRNGDPGVKMAGTWHELENQCNTIEVVETTSYQMTDLSGNTYYRIELKAHNAIGYSSPASIIMKTTRGIDVIQVADRQVLSSAAIVGIAVGGVLLLLFIVDLLCCITVHMGVMAAMCRKAKRSPSEIDDEAKLGRDEKEPLRTPTGSIKQNSTIEFDGRFVHSRSGEIIGKNSAV